VTEARPELSIVMPVYNEGQAVDEVLRHLEATVRTPHETLVVYDFDEDTTVPVIARVSAELPAVRGLRNDLGRGALNAMKSGIAAASGDYVLTMMADGSDESEIVDAMVEKARGGADVVAASRYMAGGRQIGGPRLKRFLSRMAGLTLHWCARLPIHDATSNFRLYRRTFIDSVAIESSGGFELALELTVKAHRDGRRVAEIATTWRDRTSGSSSFRLRSWLPRYLRWYAAAFRPRLQRPRAVGPTPHD
jgi:dolichol-phosphate mannosyltransferase